MVYDEFTLYLQLTANGFNDFKNSRFPKKIDVILLFYLCELVLLLFYYN